MDVKYTPPLQDQVQCSYLRRNFLTCLKQKAVKDEVPQMKCNVELLLWYNLQCPEKFKQLQNFNKLKQIFYEEKQLDNRPNKPIYRRL